MDPTQIKKIQAMNRYKRHQFLDNMYFYSLTALACSLLCCVTLCLPYITSLVRVFFLVYMSNLIAVLLSSKLLFIIGNLIIFVLIVNSRILSSDSSSTSDVYYDEYIQSSQTKKPLIPNPEVNTFENVEDGQKIVELKRKGWDKKGTAKEEENLDGGDEQSLAPPSDELNKRADDFIARVNKQRRIELSLLQCGSY